MINFHWTLVIFNKFFFFNYIFFIHNHGIQNIFKGRDKSQFNLDQRHVVLKDELKIVIKRTL